MVRQEEKSLRLRKSLVYTKVGLASKSFWPVAVIVSIVVLIVSMDSIIGIGRGALLALMGFGSLGLAFAFTIEMTSSVHLNDDHCRYIVAK